MAKRQAGCIKPRVQQYFGNNQSWKGACSFTDGSYGLVLFNMAKKNGPLTYAANDRYHLLSLLIALLSFF
jgi:hypothetical protein